MGDVLIVSVTTNPHVKKGKGRPMFDAMDRADIVRALAIVDEVILSNDLMDAMQKTHPHVVVKGREYVGRMRAVDLKYMEQNGIELAFTDTMLASSTEIISRGFRGG